MDTNIIFGIIMSFVISIILCPIVIPILKKVKLSKDCSNIICNNRIWNCRIFR